MSGSGGGVTPVAAARAWAVGNGGVIVATTDGGATWTLQASGTAENLARVTFVDANTGWAVGDNGVIVHTTDGGATWAAQASGTVRDLSGVSFVSPTTGWVSGANGTALATTDGGGTWTAQVLPTAKGIDCIGFGDATHGVGGEAGTAGMGVFAKVVRTTDGGATWTEANVVNQSSFVTEYVGFNDAVMTDSTHAWLAATHVLDGILPGGVVGEVYRSTDGGLTWTAKTVEIDSGVTGLSFLDNTNGFAVNVAGNVFRTSDGGASWSKIGSAPYGLSAISAYAPNSAMASGVGGGVIRTTDGSTFTSTATGAASLNSIKALAPL